MDPNVGTPHGKQSILRWDPSTAAAALVVGALIFLVFVNVSFGTSANLTIKK